MIKQVDNKNVYFNVVYVVGGDLTAVVVEPQEVDSKWLKALIACACARGT